MAKNLNARGCWSWDALIPIICGARAHRLHALDFAPLVRGSSNAVCLRLFLNLVDHHSARLIVRKGLWVIAIARMHPHT